MFLSKKELVEGCHLPRGYRFAYWDIMRQRGIAYPIGLHLIPRLIRRTWEWSLAYRPSTLERLLMETRKAAVARERSNPADGLTRLTSEEWKATMETVLSTLLKHREPVPGDEVCRTRWPACSNSPPKQDETLESLLLELAAEDCDPSIHYHRALRNWRAYPNNGGNRWTDGPTPLAALRKLANLQKAERETE